MKKNAKKRASRKPPVPHFHWFDKVTATALRDQLSGGPVERLEVHVDDQQNMTFHVIPQGPAPQVAVTPLNKSHYCPPDCP